MNYAVLLKYTANHLYHIILLHHFVSIRKFQPNDMFPVIKLASETLTENYNPSLFNYFYETFPEGFLVAEKFHKIVGFILGVIENINVSCIRKSKKTKHRICSIEPFFKRDIHPKHKTRGVRSKNKQ